MKVVKAERFRPGDAVAENLILAVQCAKGPSGYMRDRAPAGQQALYYYILYEGSCEYIIMKIVGLRSKVSSILLKNILRKLGLSGIVVIEVARTLPFQLF